MMDIQINGRTLTVESGSSIIEVADRFGIYIPRFCYHHALSVVASCRMCLVEIEKIGKLVPACATTVTAGMNIFTCSEKVRAAQRSVMEFLLINHPLDCPVCDQGGECELQDISMRCGAGCASDRQPKRAVSIPSLGPLIQTHMTRCIHCTRCIRFGEEIAGLRELGLMNRGEHSTVETYVPHILQSELSGNIIDLCPVGALTNKPAQFQGRAWEYREHPTISPHDGVGSHLFVHTRLSFGHQVVARAVPRACATLNEIWISDRDRFGVHGVNRDRALYPKIKRANMWQRISWDQALCELIEQTQSIQRRTGKDALAGLIGPQATLEELYVFQKLIRALGSPHVDHRMRQHDFSDQCAHTMYPLFETTIQDIERAEQIIWIGSDLHHEQPMIAHRVRQAMMNGNACVIHIGCSKISVPFPATQLHRIGSKDLPVYLHQWAEALNSNRSTSNFASLNPDQKTMILLGSEVLNHPESASIRASIQVMAQHIHAQILYLTDGPNTAGAWIAGCVPHRGPVSDAVELIGNHAKDLLTQHTASVYYLMHTELEYDSAYAHHAVQALLHAEFVVCFTPFISSAMEEYAHLILPITPFTETNGTFVNFEGQWQSFEPVCLPMAESRTGFDVLREAGEQFGISEFFNLKCSDMREELRNRFLKHVAHESQKPHHFVLRPLQEATQDSMSDSWALYREGTWSLYRNDALVRRSEALQAIHVPACAAMNAHTVQKCGFLEHDTVRLIQNGCDIILPLIINNNLANNAVWLPPGLEETAGFGTTEAPIAIEAVPHA